MITPATELKLLKKKHDKAIKELYSKHGVGSTIKHKLAFWDSQYPEGYVITHNPSNKQKVAVLELCWLTDKFPADFPHC